MYDAEAVVNGILTADAALVTLLGGQSIYNTIADNAEVFPRVIFCNYLETDEDYADDEAQGTHYYVQLDVINEGDDITDIANEAESALLAAGWYHLSSTKEGSMNNDRPIIEKHIQMVIYVEEGA